MGLATVASRAQNGLDATPVAVEVHVAGGLPGMTIVGLPEAAVRESKDRVRAALVNAGFQMPASRITVNLAPADLPKEGGRFDLAIAIGILVASGQISADRLAHCEFLGELSLSAELRPIRGALSSSVRAGRDGATLIVPSENAEEAALATDTQVRFAAHLLEICAWLQHEGELPLATPALPVTAETEGPDLADVLGQHQARRALEIAAAGGHSLLMIGPPGSGKSMLASRLPGVLPPMAETEKLAAAQVLSIGRDGFSARCWGQRPFRAPHHTASAPALVGGGAPPRPGEITLAHAGVLFLDELPEFQRAVLEALREPLESGRVVISRASQQVEYPAAFQLVAAMNPCPCGYAGDPEQHCRCTPDQVARYRGRISGPLLDRIDLQIHVARVSTRELTDRSQAGEPSASVRPRVIAARSRAIQRQGYANHQLSGAQLDEHTRLDSGDRQFLITAAERLKLSGRGLHRSLRVARTIADLSDSERLERTHLTEALAYRNQL